MKEFTHINNQGQKKKVFLDPATFKQIEEVDGESCIVTTVINNVNYHYRLLEKADKINKVVKLSGFWLIKEN